MRSLNELEESYDDIRVNEVKVIAKYHFLKLWSKDGETSFWLRIQNVCAFRSIGVRWFVRAVGMAKNSAVPSARIMCGEGSMG